MDSKAFFLKWIILGAYIMTTTSIYATRFLGSLHWIKLSLADEGTLASLTVIDSNGNHLQQEANFPLFVYDAEKDTYAYLCKEENTQKIIRYKLKSQYDTFNSGEAYSAEAQAWCVVFHPEQQHPQYPAKTLKNWGVSPSVEKIRAFKSTINSVNTDTTPLNSQQKKLIDLMNATLEQNQHLSDTWSWAFGLDLFDPEKISIYITELSNLPEIFEKIFHAFNTPNLQKGTTWHWLARKNLKTFYAVLESFSTSNEACNKILDAFNAVDENRRTTWHYLASANWQTQDLTTFYHVVNLLSRPNGALAKIFDAFSIKDAADQSVWNLFIGPNNLKKFQVFVIEQEATKPSFQIKNCLDIIFKQFDRENEDCVSRIKARIELVLLCSHAAREQFSENVLNDFPSDVVQKVLLETSVTLVLETICKAQPNQEKIKRISYWIQTQKISLDEVLKAFKIPSLHKLAFNREYLEFVIGVFPKAYEEILDSFSTKNSEGTTILEELAVNHVNSLTSMVCTLATNCPDSREKILEIFSREKEERDHSFSEPTVWHELIWCRYGQNLSPVIDILNTLSKTQEDRGKILHTFKLIGRNNVNVWGWFRELLKCQSPHSQRTSRDIREIINVLIPDTSISAEIFDVLGDISRNRIEPFGIMLVQEAQVKESFKQHLKILKDCVLMLLSTPTQNEIEELLQPLFSSLDATASPEIWKAWVIVLITLGQPDVVKWFISQMPEAVLLTLLGDLKWRWIARRHFHIKDWLDFYLKQWNKYNVGDKDKRIIARIRLILSSSDLGKDQFSENVLSCFRSEETQTALLQVLMKELSMERWISHSQQIFEWIWTLQISVKKILDIFNQKKGWPYLLNIWECLVKNDCDINTFRNFFNVLSVTQAECTKIFKPFECPFYNTQGRFITSVLDWMKMQDPNVLIDIFNKSNNENGCNMWQWLAKEKPFILLELVGVFCQNPHVKINIIEAFSIVNNDGFTVWILLAGKNMSIFCEILKRLLKMSPFTDKVSRIFNTPVRQEETLLYFLASQDSTRLMIIFKVLSSISWTIFEKIVEMFNQQAFKNFLVRCDAAQKSTVALSLSHLSYHLSTTTRMTLDIELKYFIKTHIKTKKFDKFSEYRSFPNDLSISREDLCSILYAYDHFARNAGILNMASTLMGNTVIDSIRILGKLRALTREGTSSIYWLHIKKILAGKIIDITDNPKKSGTDYVFTAIYNSFYDEYQAQALHNTQLCPG